MMSLETGGMMVVDVRKPGKTAVSRVVLTVLSFANGENVQQEVRKQGIHEDLFGDTVVGQFGNLS